MDNYQQIGSNSHQNDKSCFQRYKPLWAIVFAFCVGGLIFPIVLITRKGPDQEVVVLPPFSFSDAFNSSFATKGASLYWTSNPDENGYTGIVNNTLIYKYTINPPSTTLLLNLSALIDPNSNTNQSVQMYDYVLSRDQQWILLRTNHQPVYRYSSFDNYLLVRLNDNYIINVNQGIPLQYAVMAPSGQHLLAYVVGNNIFLLNWDTQNTIQITSDGVSNSVINGICDWVFEEEVFGQTSAIWWSPDGSYFAFLRFKESNVSQYQFPIYESPYNEEYIYKYPKAGSTNSIVDLGVYAVTNQIVTWPNIGSSAQPDQYVIEIKWFGSSNLAVKTMPRLQNEWQLLSINVVTNEISSLYSEHHPLYLEPHTALTFINSTYYLDIIVSDDYDHIGLFNVQDGSLVKMLTSGNDWGVTEIVAIHQDYQVVFYISTRNVGPLERALWAVRIADASSTRPVGDNGRHVFQSASFSANSYYFVLQDSGDLPTTGVYRLNYDLSCDMVSALENNTVALELFKTKAMPQQWFVNITNEFGTTGGNYLNGFWYLPYDFDYQKKYPVLVYVYGGPGYQNVLRTFPYGTGRLGWHNYLVSTQNILVLYVDGIGTGGRGDSFQKNSTYMHLGVNESLDCIAVGKYLQTLGYVNTSQVALWGWSYGGYLSSMVAGEKDVQQYFNTIMAVAPVLQWELYDTIYTERYMRTPQNNTLGYNGSSVLNRINNSTWVKKFLLVHGTGDDNVHFQNGALLADGLVKKNIQFDTMFYTNRAHSLTGPNGEANTHLYTFLTRYLLASFNMTEKI